MRRAFITGNDGDYNGGLLLDPDKSTAMARRGLGSAEAAAKGWQPQNPFGPRTQAATRSFTTLS